MSTTLDRVVDTLKEQLRADPSIIEIVTEKVMAACQGDRRSSQWLQGDGSIWLLAVDKFLEEGGKIPYP